MIMAYTTDSFFSETPPERYIGTECEYNLQYADGLDLGSFIDLRALAKIGIESAQGMLGNGGRAYLDGGHIEYASAEALGPREAAIADIAGVLVTSQMVRNTGLSHRGLYRVTGTFMSNGKGSQQGRGTTSGYHENYLFPRSVSNSEWLEWMVPAHLASRLWAWVPTLRENGMTLSQKAAGIGGITVERTFTRRIDHGNKPMCIIPPISSDYDVTGEEQWSRLEVRFADAGQSPFGRYMSHGTNSLVLRMVEHLDKLDARKLSALTLANPVHAAHVYSQDWTLGSVVSTADGRFVSALNVQEGLSELAHDLADVIELPPDERIVPDLWTDLIDRLRRSNPEDCDWQDLEKLIDLAAKASFLLERYYPNELVSSNNKAMSANLLWDRVLPTGVAQIWWQAHPAKIIAAEEVKTRMTQAPRGRAQQRASYINKRRIRANIDRINWVHASSKGKTKYFQL